MIYFDGNEFRMLNGSERLTTVEFGDSTDAVEWKPLTTTAGEVIAYTRSASTSEWQCSVLPQGPFQTHIYSLPQPHDLMDRLNKKAFWVLILEIDEDDLVLRYQQPTLVLATDRDQALVAGTRLAPTDYGKGLTECIIHVREF